MFPDLCVPVFFDRRSAGIGNAGCDVYIVNSRFDRFQYSALWAVAVMCWSPWFVVLQLTLNRQDSDDEEWREYWCLRTDAPSYQHALA